MKVTATPPKTRSIKVELPTKRGFTVKIMPSITLQGLEEKLERTFPRFNNSIDPQDGLGGLREERAFHSPL